MVRRTGRTWLFERPSYLRAADNADPAIKRLFREMRLQHLTISEVAHISGIERSTLRSWKRARQPTLGNIRAALNAVGCDLVVVLIDGDDHIGHPGEGGGDAATGN